MLIENDSMQIEQNCKYMQKDLSKSDLEATRVYIKLKQSMLEACLKTFHLKIDLVSIYMARKPLVSCLTFYDPTNLR